MFRRFLVARVVAWGGATITLVALPLAIYQRTHSPTLTALLTALEGVPYLLLGLFAGVLADRFDRRRIMVATTVMNAVLLASIPAAYAAGLLTVGHLLVVAGASSSTLVFFDAANFGVLPALVGRNRLAQATGVTVAVSTVIGLVGPAVGGALAAAFGPATAITVDAVALAIAALLLARLHVVPAADTPPAVRRRVGVDIAEGLRFIWNHPLVRPLTLLGVGNSLTGGAVFGLIVVVAVQRIGLPDTDARIGWLYVAGSLGALGASMALPRLTRRVPVGWLTIGGLAANCLFLALWATATQLAVALVALVLWEGTYSLVIQNGIVARQQVTPDALQGRVNTTARMIAWGGHPLGATLGGVLASAYGVTTALLVAGGGVAASALLAWATPLRLRSTTVRAYQPADLSTPD